MKVDYLQAKDYIANGDNGKILLGLDRVRKLCEFLGNPQDKVKLIHIAGTNGKGSVGTFIASVLIASGYKVGRYTSPEVLNYRDKFSINGQWIKEEEFASLTDVISRFVDKMSVRPTPFEIETALAYYYFEQNDCDFAVVECGMGGTDDATNVADNKLLSVLTPVALDHTRILGDTLEKITKQKIGIVKNSPLVSAVQYSEVRSVLESEISDLTLVDENRIVNKKLSFEDTVFDYKEYKSIKIKMLGKFQCENAALALEVIDKLKEWGYKIDKVYEGMEKALWPCRFDLVSTEPTIIIDGAHNPHGALALRENIKYYLIENTIAFVMGVLADKDYESLVEITASLATSIYTVTPNCSRGLSAEKLAECVKLHNKNVQVMASIERAIDNALADGSEAIVIFGSLSFLSEVYKFLGGETVD